MRRISVAILAVILIPLLAIAADYRAQMIPWIVADGDWWAGVNLKNASSYDCVATITEFDESGSEIDSYSVTVLANGTHKWSVDDGVRSILIEGPDSLFVTAHQGRGQQLTELSVREITHLKN